jgi:RecB family exonuclease
VITVVLGRYRWRRRRALARLGFATVDPFGRPNTLFLTDSQRKRDVVGRTAASRSTFEPDTRVLGALFDDLWTRFGDGRAAVDAWTLTARVLERLGSDPTPTERDDPAALALQLVHTGLAELRMRTRVPLQPTLRALVDEVLAPTDTTLPVPRAHAALARRLADPDPALAAWLARCPPVIVDDLAQPTPLQTDVLLALVGALAAAGTPVALSFVVGHDAGPAAVAELFGAGEKSPWAQRDLAATAAWRRAVFDRVLATGDARIVFATDDGPVPADEAVPESPDAVDHWSAGNTAPLPAGVTLASHERPEAEAQAVADAVHACVRDGVAIDDLLVAVAEPGVYREPLLHAFVRRGLPVDLGLGRPLGSTPVGQAVFLALHSLRRELDPLEWLTYGALLGQPVEDLRRGLSPAGVHRGPPGTWRGRLLGHARRTEQPVAPLAAAIDALEAARPDRIPDTTQPFGDTIEQLLSILSEHGFAALCEISDANRRAWATVVATLDPVARGLGSVVLERASVASLALAALGRALVYTPQPGGIRIVGLLELRGLTAPHTWIVGCRRTAWPAQPAANALIPPEANAALQPVDRLAEARHLVWNGIRDHLGRTGAAGSFSLSWSRTVGGRPAVASRVLVELLELSGEEAVRCGSGALDPVGRVVPEPRGRLVDPPPFPARLGVTAAETAMQCPARFWYHHVLRLRPEDPWDPELEPRRRGTALHRIFQEFYEDRDLTVVSRADRDAAARRLHAIATEVLDEVESAGGFEPALQAWARGRWLAGLVDDAPMGILAAWLEEEIARGIAPRAVEQPVELVLGARSLVGTVDRIDDVAGVVGVIDYKTGQAPRRERVERGLALQPLVYLQALAPDRPAASAFQLVRRPDSLRFAGWFGDREATRVLGGSRPVVADADGRRERLEQVHARLEAVAGGQVSPTEWGEDLGGCTYCAFHHVCRVSHDTEPPC